MGYSPPEMSLFVAPVTFLLAQKRGNKREFVEPARALAKKGTLPNASARNPARPSLGKEANTLFFGLVLRTTP